MKVFRWIFPLLAPAVLMSCKGTSDKTKSETMDQPDKKIVVYQVFTRLFGNTNTANIPWGTIEDNGVGKFNDFTDQALEEIRALGVTHIWYTGVPPGARDPRFSAGPRERRASARLALNHIEPGRWK